MLDGRDVKNLGAGRWVVPMMALAAERGGANLEPMAEELGVSRAAAKRTIGYIHSSRWAVPNPVNTRYQSIEHPLTPRGDKVAAACRQMMALRSELGVGPEDLLRWSLPLIANLANGRARFGELQLRLAPITPRALSQTLRRMSDCGLIKRDGDTPYYNLTEAGEEIAKVLTGG